MSGSVKKVFTVLIIVVACVMVGALVLNVLLPNVAISMVDAVEQMVYNATGMKFDWNGNGTDVKSGGVTDFRGSSTEKDNTGTGNKAGDTVEGLG